MRGHPKDFTSRKRVSIILLTLITVQTVFGATILNFARGATASPVLNETGAIPIEDPFAACHADSYDIMADIGVKMNRKDISWSSIEPSDDAWNWKAWDARCTALEAHNMTALPILDYGNLKVQTGVTHGNRINTEADIARWLEYVNASVYRYYKNNSLQVDTWEIWNEPNLGNLDASSGFWTGTDAEFFHLQEVTARMLREQYPDLKILSGGISGHDPDYLDRMFKAGALNDIDVLAFHPYSGSAYDTLNQKIQEVWAVCEENSFDGEVWITEVGMSTQFDPANPRYAEDYRNALETQASIVPKIYAQSLANRINVIVWYCLGDFANWTWGEANFGLVYAGENTFKPIPYQDDVLKPAGYAYKALAYNLNWTTYYPRGIQQVQPFPSEAIQAYYFRKTDGDVVLICWNAQTENVPVTIQVPGIISSVEAFGGPAYKPGAFKDISLSHGTEKDVISTNIGFTPLILVLDLPEGTCVPVYLEVSMTFFEFSLWIGIPVMVILMAVAFVITTMRKGRG